MAATEVELVKKINEMLRLISKNGASIDIAVDRAAVLEALGLDELDYLLTVLTRLEGVMYMEWELLVGFLDAVGVKEDE